jgi:hippurate hydrolase
MTATPTSGYRGDDRLLSERWPVDAVFGLHKMPGLERGKLHFRDGAMMATVDNWEIELTGTGSHGSMPELSVDPVVAGASMVHHLQYVFDDAILPMGAAYWVALTGHHLR